MQWLASNNTLATLKFDNKVQYYCPKRLLLSTFSFGFRLGSTKNIKIWQKNLNLKIIYLFKTNALCKKIKENINLINN